MVRKVMAVLVSGALWLGSTNAVWTQTAAPPASTASSTSAPQNGNAAPLPPGGAAGIRQAQGTGDTVWHIIGLGFLGAVVLAMIFVGNDEDEEIVTTTTTN